MDQAAIDYAWNWFSYHAKQRLAAFNFFLVVVAFLAAGIVSTIENDLPWIQLLLSSFGAVVCVAFLALDVRNLQLVNHGRAALRTLEPSMTALPDGILLQEPLGSEKQAALGELMGGSSKAKIRVSHTLWLRRIQRVAFWLFLISAAFAIFRASKGGPVEAAAVPGTYALDVDDWRERAERRAARVRHGEGSASALPWDRVDPATRRAFERASVAFVRGETAHLHEHLHLAPSGTFELRHRSRGTSPGLGLHPATTLRGTWTRQGERLTLHVLEREAATTTASYQVLHATIHGDGSISIDRNLRVLRSQASTYRRLKD